jgi:hypothetical protein
VKTPAELAVRWARQWENPDLREARLLDEAAWPASLAIGRPTAPEIASDWYVVAARIHLWRDVRTGSVRWEMATFRATREPIEVPAYWEISSPDEWIAAANDRTVRSEYETLRHILEGTDAILHATLIRERSLWRQRPTEEVIRAGRLSMQLAPGSAEGRPLRAISMAGIDSKFLERNASLIVRLLDIRFDGEASRQGLEIFLNAWRETAHWLLLADLSTPPLLPFPQIRVRATDLATTCLQARALLVVENETCLHLLPRDLPGVIAILGTGNNLAWLNSGWLQRTPIGYWGDIDTWGMTLLARARAYATQLVPILMTREVFDLHSSLSVSEKIHASESVPDNLSAAEASLYRHLLGRSHGRLEQEFLSAPLVGTAIRAWAAQQLGP